MYGQITFISFLILAIVGCNVTPNSVSSEHNDIENNFIFLDTTYEMTLNYIGMGCPCPQWATAENTTLFEESLNTIAIPMDSLFVTLSPQTATTVNPFSLEGGNTSFVFTGRLSSNKYTWMGEDGSVWSNLVFQYEKVRIDD